MEKGYSNIGKSRNNAVIFMIDSLQETLGAMGAPCRRLSWLLRTALRPHFARMHLIRGLLARNRSFQDERTYGKKDALGSTRL
jgi:hypothetical protein